MTGHLVPLLFWLLFHSKSAIEFHRGLVACGWRGGMGEGPLAPLVVAEESLQQESFSSAAFCLGPHILEDTGLWNHPLLTLRGFLSGTPFPFTSQMGFCGEGLFSCFNNPLSTTKLPLVKISIIAYAILLALLETTFHPLNRMVALSQNSEWV